MLKYLLAYMFTTFWQPWSCGVSHGSEAQLKVVQSKVCLLKIAQLKVAQLK